jgi:hypothetical protein
MPTTPRPPRRPSPRELAAAIRRVERHAAWYARNPLLVVNDLRRLDHLLFHQARWQVATTMPENPHCYTRARSWDWPGGADDYLFVVDTIHAIGDHEKYPPVGRGAYYTVLHRGPAIFWTLFPPWHKILINRKPPTLPTDRR